MSKEIDSEQIAEVYLHISNGGVSFAIFDGDHGPEIRIISRQFGNNEIVQRIMTDQESIQTIGAMFVDAAARCFGKPYCHAATIEHRRGGECSQGGDASPFI